MPKPLRLTWLDWLSLLAALLVAGRLSSAHLLENRFHPDEAHYAGFARLIASGPGHGLLLSHIIVDKPPLSFYVQGLSVALIGSSELALRLPSLLAGILNVALVYGLGRRLYRRPAAHAAAWALALSPFAAQFAITAFVDPLLTTLLLAALFLTAARHLLWAAALLGLAFATKQTALFFVPLVLALDLWLLPRPVTLRSAGRRLPRTVLPIIAALVLTAIVLVAWDFRRQAPISIWQQGYSDNISSQPISLAELRPRAAAILSLLAHYSDFGLINAIFLVGLAALMITGALRRARSDRFDWLWAGYISGYLALFWLVPFNLWDRYFLPLLPLAALLAGRIAEFIGRLLLAGSQLLLRGRTGLTAQKRRLLRAEQFLLPVLALAVILPPVAVADYDFSPVGGDHGAYDGIDSAAAFIQTLPPGAILYDHWLGWELEYYLFERAVPVVWFPDMAGLEHDLLAAPRGQPQYLIMPWWASEPDAKVAVGRAGRQLVAVHSSYRRDGIVSITVYQIAP